MTAKTLAGSFALCAAILATLSGCTPLIAQRPPGLTNSPLSQDEYAEIANDLVDTLASLDEVEPSVTTFQMVAPTTAFGREIFGAIEAKGYGIQLVKGDLGNRFLAYKAENSQTQNGYRNAYSVTIGEIHLEREYARNATGLTPSSPIRVSGVREQAVNSEAGLDSSNVAFTTVPEIIALVVDDRERAGGVANVFDRQGSNYASTFTQYDDLDVQTLVFANDSVRLDTDNKRALERMASGVDPTSDVISVIGCSLGKTSIDNGNRILAEGRTNRVKEWLMFAGVDTNIILDEACWAEEYWDEAVPRRGVVVTHKRSIEEG